MDLALNPKLIELLPRHVQELAEHHGALNGEIDKRIGKIDDAITAAGHDTMDLALNSDLRAQAPSNVRKMMVERGILVDRDGGAIPKAEPTPAPSTRLASTVGGREASNLMYPTKPNFHDDLIATGHRFAEVKGADGRTYYTYKR
jgi:hypothetical protein